MKITRTSIFSNKTRTRDLKITEAEWNLYLEGETVIQKCFPDLTNSEREFIISGSSDAEWAALAPDEDESEEIELKKL